MIPLPLKNRVGLHAMVMGGLPYQRLHGVAEVIGP